MLFMHTHVVLQIHINYPCVAVKSAVNTCLNIFTYMCILTVEYHLLRISMLVVLCIFYSNALEM